MKLLPGPFSYVAVELNIGRVELGFAGLQISVQALNEAGNFVAIKMAAVIVQVVEIGYLIVLRFVVAALDAPYVGPVRRGRMVGAEKVERT